MKLRYKLGILVSGLLVAFLYGRCAKPKTTSPGILPKDDTERITVNPETHKLIIQRPGQKPQTLTLPDQTSTFDVKQNGTVKVSSKQFGFEEHPFVGYAVSDIGRFVAGSDLTYYKKLDLGLGLGIQKDLGSFIGFAKISYNVWSNVSLGLSIDNQKHIGGILTVRL